MTAAKIVHPSNGLTERQVEFLLRPIHSSRVLSDNKGMAHVSQQDVRAHLTRIFGFGGWSSEVKQLDLVREAPGKDKTGKDKGWAVTYRALVRLTIRNPAGEDIAVYEDVATGTSPNLPTLGDAHDFACKVAVSMALKRAATNLGDGFGLSLYNKGQRSALVIDTIVKPSGDGSAQDEIPQQVSLGHDDAGSTEPEDLSAERTPGNAAERTPWTEPVAQPARTTDKEWLKAWSQIVASAVNLDILREQEERLKEQWTARRLTEADKNDAKGLLDEKRVDLETEAQRAERDEAKAS